ncbi:alpha/beta hydrolase family protein [Chloroflexota bacterium]
MDETREDRELRIRIWYPAIIPEGVGIEEETYGGHIDAELDSSGARYPLILFSHWYTSSSINDFKLFKHLASHGFIVASIDHRCDSKPTCLVDRPMDVLFALDQIAQETEDRFAGVVDTDHAGVMGISFGGYTALAAAGA